MDFGGPILGFRGLPGQLLRARRRKSHLPHAGGWNLWRHSSPQCIGWQRRILQNAGEVTAGRAVGCQRFCRAMFRSRLRWSLWQRVSVHVPDLRES
ncbi:hypothetical protein AAY473_040370 [Plecturocebus cupreus]